MKIKCLSTGSPIAILLLGMTLVLGGCDKLRSYTDAEHVQRAKDFQAKGDYKAAVIELKNALNKNGNNAEARWLLGEAYLDFEEGAQAEKELKRARDLGINVETLMIPLGRAYVLQGKYREVLAEITPGKQASTRARAHILKLHGDAQIGQRKGKEGCDLYQQSHQADTKFIDAYWGVAWCFSVKGDLKSARAKLETALEIDRTNARTWSYLGDFARLEGRHAEAEQAYLMALKTRPHDSEARLNLASVYLTQNKLDAASKEIAKVRKELPQHPHARYLEALFSYRQGKYTVARDQLQELVRAESNFLPALLLSGAVSLKLGEYETAEKSLTVFLGQHPKSKFARELLAEIQLRKGNANLALETIMPLLDSDAVTARALSIAGEASVAKGDLAQATDYLERASKLQPGSAEIRASLGASRLKQGDVNRAVADLEAASGMDQKHTAADITLILTRAQRKDYDGAFAALAALEKKQPASPVPHNLRGGIHLAKGEDKLARSSFEQALSKQATYLPAARNLAQLDLKQKNPAAARLRYERVLDKDKTNYGAMQGLAEIAAIERNEKDYVGWLEKAARANAKAIEPRALLVEYYLGKKDAQKALSYARDIQTANPQNPVGFDLMGRVQLAAGEKEGALASYTKFAEMLPQSPVGQFRLGVAQTRLEKHQAARTSFRKAVELKPDYLEALTALATLEMEQGRFPEALQAAKTIQRQAPQSGAGWALEGELLVGKRKLEESLQAFSKAQSIEPKSSVAMRLHQVRSSLKREKEADAALLEWLKQHPGDLDVRLYYAASLGARKQHKPAIEQYESILKLKPEHVYALNNLAAAYQEDRDKRALPTAEHAYKLAPGNALVLDTLGWILIEQGDAKRGKELLRQAAEKAPTSGSIHYHYAVALANAGDKTGAKRELELALKNDKGFEEREAAKGLLGKL